MTKRGDFMNYKIVDRINNVLDKDKMNDPQILCDILKDEIEPIVKNYISLNNEIKVRYKKENEKNIFWIEVDADRIKPFGYLPY
jgi:septum formation topological specificity factor MinE